MAYIEPTYVDLRARYAAFAAVDDATITYWLTDAHRMVDTSWMEEDYPVALIAYAAYRMTEEGVAGLAGSEISDIAASGVTSFKSGTFSASFSDAAASQAAAGGYQANRYGREYWALLLKNRGGPRVTGHAPGPCGCGYRDAPLWPYGG